MKRAILTATTVLVAWAATTAHASEPKLTVLLAGGSEANMISIALSPDGRDYVINSVVPLDVGGNLCAHPEGRENELICAATSIGGFEVNSGAGDDSVVVGREVPVPVTLRGGPGADRLVGGSGADRLVGGSGDDVLVGRLGDDSLFGGPGRDTLLGGPGSNQLVQ